MGVFLYLLVIVINSCNAFDIPRSSCKPNLTIDDNHYNVTHTYHVGDSFPTDAHYDDKGNLFFVEAGRNDQGYFFNIKVIRANSTKPQDIPGLPVGKSYSIAISKSDSKVYFGTSDGIFVYNYDTGEATLVSDPGLKLNMIFVDKDGNKYITDSPDGVEELYLLAGDKKIRFRSLEALDELAVDDRNNFYYIKEEKLFVLKSDSSRAKYIGNVAYAGYAQITFYKDNVFIASETLTYIHENDTGPLKLVKNIPGKVTAVAFDREGNFVLGIRGKFLKYSNSKHCNRSLN
ncbi:uncharacterized protein LOC121732416 [Aricia agestis]|uniref:uncharacterized protein LOC121732416 n=1 Tax=Aricia agestis TaxID=91739 RepID=UPI001C20BC42|nr:uncharacterized protein LOC121732416 [Aricia agestis]